MPILTHLCPLGPNIRVRSARLTGLPIILNVNSSTQDHQTQCTGGFCASRHQRRGAQPQSRGVGPLWGPHCLLQNPNLYPSFPPFELFYGMVSMIPEQCIHAEPNDSTAEQCQRRTPSAGAAQGQGTTVQRSQRFLVLQPPSSVSGLHSEIARVIYVQAHRLIRSLR